MTVVLTGRNLTCHDIRKVARSGAFVVLTPEAREQVAAARAVVEAALGAGSRVYGLTTGLGVLKRVDLDPAQVAATQARFLEMHEAGQGKAYPREVVRAAVVRLANQYALGASGVRPELVDRLVDWLNADGDARVRRVGGSLVTNAELAVEVVGDMALAEGEALALLGHSSFLDGLTALAVGDLWDLVAGVEAAAAMSFEAFRASLSPLDPRVVALKGGVGLAGSAERMRLLLDGSELWQPSARRNLQDPISFRACAYVVGALCDALEHADRTMAVQLNSSSGNPVVVVDDAEILHTANWEVATVTSMIDFVKVCLASVVTMSQERSIKLLDRVWSGLPTGLVSRDGLGDSGLAMFQIVVSALTVELRSLAAATSYDLSSTSQAEGIEDRSHWGQMSARRLHTMLHLAEQAVAIELVVAAQALELRGLEHAAPRVREIQRRVRNVVPLSLEGDPLPRDLEPVVGLIRSRGLVPSSD